MRTAKVRSRGSVKDSMKSGGGSGREISNLRSVVLLQEDTDPYIEKWEYEKTLNLVSEKLSETESKEIFLLRNSGFVCLFVLVIGEYS